MNQTMSLKAMVDQISNQLEIADHHEESKYLRVIEDHPTRVYTSNEGDYFLVPTDSEIEAEQERLDSLYVSIRNYPDLEGNFLAIRTEPSRREIFTPFIAEFLLKDMSDPISTLEDTLGEWKELWSGRGGRLSGNQQRGLLGELVTLHHLINEGGPKMVEKWGGPLEWVHDFESDNINLEIKTTMIQPASVHISMIKQVAPMEGEKELHLVVVGLEPGEELSLKKEVAVIRRLLQGTEHANRFEHVLRRSGFRDEHSSFYSRGYTNSYIRAHKITHDSPVLNPAVLGEIPSTVVNIRYNLEVHAMDMVDADESIWKRFTSLL